MTRPLLPALRRSLAESAAAFSCALLAATPLSAVADTIDASSQVVGALVYPRGATIEREARFAAPEGRHEIVIGDLPVDLDVDSLRVAGVAEATEDGASAFAISGISHKIRAPRAEPASDPERQKLLDQLEALQWELRAAKDAVAEAAARVSYMAAFRDATVGRPPFFRGGPGKRPEAGPERWRPAPAPAGGLFEASGRWTEAWALIASESAAARQAQRAAEQRRDAVSKEIDALRDALDKAGPPPPARSELTVSIAADSAIADGALTVKYLTRKARWSPLYDLKLDTADSAKPGLQGALTLARRASVTQSTGENWDGVRLQLSTARPTGRIETRPPKPLRVELKPQENPKERARRATQDLRSESAPKGLDDYTQNVAPAPLQAQLEGAVIGAALGGLVARETSALAAYSGAGVVYDIPEPARIPGDGGSRQVRILEETAEVALVARANPAKEKTAYLYAVHRNMDAPLLPGRASIYRDGVFYGQFRLKYVAPSDETALPFGPLDEVKVEHQVLTVSKGEEGGLFTSTANSQQSSFKMTARNLGETPRAITLFAARPYSETEKIEVKATGRKPTEETVEGRRGVLAWTFELAPGAQREIPFGYTITWPEKREMRIR